MASLQTLNVIVFPGGFNLPLWAAERQGFFEQNGARVVLTPTPSSVFQIQGLAEGRFDIAMTAIDNIVAYHEPPGATWTTCPSSKRSSGWVAGSRSSTTTAWSSSTTPAWST